MATLLKKEILFAAYVFAGRLLCIVSPSCWMVEMGLISCRFGDVKISVLEMTCHAQSTALQLPQSKCIKFLIMKQYAEKHCGMF